MKKISGGFIGLLLVVVLLAGCTREEYGTYQPEETGSYGVTPQFPESALVPDGTAPQIIDAASINLQMAGIWIFYESNPEHAARINLYANGRWELPHMGGSFQIANEVSGIYYLRFTTEHSSVSDTELGFEFEECRFDAQNDRLGQTVGWEGGYHTLWFRRE